MVEEDVPSCSRMLKGLSTNGIGSTGGVMITSNAKISILQFCGKYTNTLATVTGVTAIAPRNYYSNRSILANAIARVLARSNPNLRDCFGLAPQ